MGCMRRKRKHTRNGALHTFTQDVWSRCYFTNCRTFALDACHRDARDAARYNPIEGVQIIVRIECKSVRRHPFARMYANGGEFSVSDPDTCLSRSPTSPKPPLTKRDDQRLFHLTQVPMQVLSVPPQIENGLADKLPGFVNGYVPATLNIAQHDTVLREHISRGEQVAGFG